MSSKKNLLALTDTSATRRIRNGILAGTAVVGMACGGLFGSSPAAAQQRPAQAQPAQPQAQQLAGTIWAYETTRNDQRLQAMGAGP
jgi:hypothetical protein